METEKKYLFESSDISDLFLLCLIWSQELGGFFRQRKFDSTNYGTSYGIGTVNLSPEKRDEFSLLLTDKLTQYPITTYFEGRHKKLGLENYQYGEGFLRFR